MEKRNRRTSKKKRAASRKINPVKAKLASMSECFEQLRNGLPESHRKAYINGDRITHSYVKSCFLMIIQRAVDINNVITEFKGKTPHQQKHHSFLILHQNSAIDKETLDFFMKALECYESIINPYQEFALLSFTMSLAIYWRTEKRTRISSKITSRVSHRQKNRRGY